MTKFRLKWMGVLGALALVGILAATVFAADEVMEDDTSDGIGGSGGIEAVEVHSNGGQLVVSIDLAASRSSQFKYRVHFDNQAPFREVILDECITHSDFTSKLFKSNKTTGPGMWTDVSGTRIVLSVPYAEVGAVAGVPIHVWVDTHRKGIVDRAPDTFNTGGTEDPVCLKPENAAEVITIVPIA